MCQSASWEVGNMKHVDMGVTILLTSLVSVLVSYMFRISSQNFTKAEKFGRVNSACGYKHQFFSRKNVYISFPKHYNSFLFLRICISCFALGKLSVII